MCGTVNPLALFRDRLVVVDQVHTVLPMMDSRSSSTMVAGVVEDSNSAADEDGTGTTGMVHDDTDDRQRLVRLHQEYTSAECRKWIRVEQQLEMPQCRPSPSHFLDDGRRIH